MRLPRSAQIYIALVCLAGTALAGLLGALDARGLAEHASPAVAALVVLAIVGEFVPIRVFRRSAEGELTVSSAFAFALLLAAGPATALATILVASVAADLHLRKPFIRVWFNGAQYAIAMAMAWAVLHRLTDVPHATGPSFLPADLPWVMIAALAFFLTNALLVALVLALAQGFSVRDYLREDLVFVAGAAGMALALAPLAVLAVDFSVLLVVTLALPLAAVWRGARQALELEHHSLHDSLTGLPNRSLLRSRIEGALATASVQEGRGLIVMLLDLDHFKEINDTLGHGHGDHVLTEVAGRLAASLREGDVVARLGGDEFALLLTEDTTQAEAVALARRVLDAVSEPVDVEGVTLRVGGSIGIAVWPEHGTDVDTLLRRADIAMYVAKSGRTGIELYHPDQDRHTPARLSLAGELRQALDQRDLLVQYQPQSDMVNGRIVGVEALVRWRHRERGLLGPDEFVGLAESTGLIAPMTLMVLDASLAQLRSWDRLGLDLNMAINLSTRNLLDRDLPDQIHQRLRAHAIPAARLEIEITESMVAADPDRVSTVLRRIHALGVRITLDDFGTGYSSLANLRDLPVQRLKVDRSFVSGMVAGHQDAVIVASTIDMAQRLGLTVVAEGVEDAGTWEALRVAGCDLAQGYALSPALDGDALVGWLRRRGTGHPELREAA